MAITITDLASGYDITDATSYVTPSISPSANALLLAPYSLRHGTSAPGVTVSGGGLDWVEIIPEQIDGLSSIGCWYAQCGASPGSFAVTYTVDGGVTAIGVSVCLIDIVGHERLDPIVATYLAATGLTGATGTITYSALANAGNAQFTYFMHRGNSASTLDASGGWTGTTDGFNSAPNHGARGEWKIAAADLTSTMTWTSVRWQGLGVEIRLAGTKPVTTSPLINQTVNTSRYW